MRRMLAGDWIGSLRLAGTTLGTSLLLALLFGLTGRPAAGGLHWGFKTTAAWIAWVWESTFGVGVVGHTRVRGSADVLDLSLNGSASADGWLSAMPLTLTVLTLVVTVIAFRRAITRSPSAIAAWLLGVRAALLTAVPLLVVAWIVSLNTRDLTDLADGRTGRPRPWDSLDTSASLSLSAADAFFVSFALLVVVFSAVVVLRSEWFTGRWATLHLVLVTPVRAFGRLALGLVVSGLLFELVIWQVRWHTRWPGIGHRPSLTVHEWVNAFAIAIAYAGNAGVMALGLGSLGQSGVVASGHASAASMDQSGSLDKQHWIGWFAAADNLSYGVWIGLLIAPALLAWVIGPILWTHRAEARAQLTHAGTWLVSLVVALPVVAMLANLAAGGSGNADAAWGSFGFNGNAHGSARLGLAVLVSSFAVFVSALAVSVVVVVTAQLTRGRRSSATDSDPPSSPR